MAEDLRRNCELCAEEAVVYCPCDAAFLCYACDDKVHRANFLVARHVRVDLCRVCRNFAGKRYSVVGKSSASKIACESCSPELEKINKAGVEDEDNDRVSSTSSSCVSCTSSSASSRRRRRKIAGDTPFAAAVAVDAKVEGILVIWCRKMDINEDDNSSVVREVVEVVSKSMGKMTVLPFRVLLAGAFWSVIRTRDGGELTRLEQISGVPRQLIMATESRLARVVKRRQSRADHEEGWAES